MDHQDRPEPIVTAPDYEKTGIYDPMAMLRDFHVNFEHHCENTPTIDALRVADKVIALRKRLVKEETGELIDALDERDLIEAADGIGDALYVIYGTAVSLGIDAHAIMAEVHRSNMTKYGGGKDEGGKSIKPPWYEKPDIAGVLKRQKPLFFKELERDVCPHGTPRGTVSGCQECIAINRRVIFTER